MRYLTREAIEAAIPALTLMQLTNDDPAATAPDEGVLAAVIENVEELVDGYIRARYPQPFEKVPSVLRGVAVNLLRYELYIRRPEGAVPETVKEAYGNAIKLLGNIRDGRVQVGETGVSDAGKPVSEPGPIRVRVRPQRFDEAGLKGY